MAGVVNSAPGGSVYGLVTWNQPSGTQAVSGTVTATQATGTNLHVVVDSAPTTAVTGTVTTTPPANASTNLTQLNSVGLGSPSNYGTSPGAVEVQGVNAFVTNAVAVTGTFFQATQPISGTVTSNQGTANTLANAWPTELTDGTNGPAAIKAASTAAIATDKALVVAVSPNNSVAVTGTFFQGTQPVSGTVTANQGTANTAANSWSVEVTDGTNVLGTSSHPLRIDPTGTTTQPVSGTVTVGNASLAVTQSTSPWVVGQGTAANLNATVIGTVSAKLQDGSGNLITSDTRGSERPLSVQILDASGNQITSFGGSGGNAAAGATGSPVPLDADYVGYNSGGNLVGVSTSNALPVAQQGSVAVTGTFFQGTQPISGTVTANQGTANTTANAWPVELTDGTNVNSVKAASTASASTDKSLVVQLNPIQPNLTTALNVQAISGSTTAVTQGTASNLNATVVGSGVFEVSPTTAANTNSNPFFNSITDGTTKATVIAATAALKTDLSSVAGTVTVTAASGVQKVGITGNANATLDAAINTGAAPTNALWTATAPVTVAAGALSSSLKSAQATAVNIKASAGNLYGFAIVSATATAGFIQFFNTATTATTGAVLAVPIAASGTVILQPGHFALLNFTTGIAINVATPLNGTTTQITWTGTVFFL